MEIDERRAKLMNLGVQPAEMYVFNKQNDPSRLLLIVRRTGIEKIEKLLKISYKYVSVTESSYKNGSNVTIVLEGGSKELGFVQALGSANPDTTKLPFISDLANKRARHKIVLKLADLYQHDVHSEDESEDFRPAKTLDSDAMLNEARSSMGLPTK
jgi:hypothetical protein